MNLLCPNCQKMLTVPEEFAGQLMKCPLCSGNFTVPGLPGAAPPSTAPESDIYAIRHEPSPPPPAPQLDGLESPPASPATAPTLSPQPPSPMDYQHILTVSLSPKVLPWIAPVCLVLIFFVQFLDWDGLYPGGAPAATANAWYAAFGKYPVDGDLKTLVPFTTDDKFKPGVSVLTIFYLMLFFPTLLVTIASVVFPMLQLKLPPQVDKLMPWRWGIVAAANLIVFFFLALQLLLGFSLDSQYRDWVEKETQREVKENPTTQERKLAEAHRGELLDVIQHTVWLRRAVLLHLVAILGAVLMFWIDRRGTQHPFPKMELRW